MSITIDGTNGITFPNSTTQTGAAVVSDPYWKYRLFRSDFEGTNGDTTTFNYVSAQPVGMTNSAQISTAQYKFGSSSLLCAGGGVSAKPQCVYQMNTPISSASGYTIEMWIYPTSFTNSSFPGIFDFGSSTTVRVGLYFTSATTVVLRLDATSNSLTLSTIGISLNTWSHIAVEKVGSTITLYVNGVSEASYSYSTSITSSWTMSVGNTIDGYPMAGYIDDFRMTIGYTVYGGAFTPPSSALPIGPYSQLNVGPILN